MDKYVLSIDNDFFLLIIFYTYGEKRTYVHTSQKNADHNGLVFMGNGNMIEWV